MLNMDVMQELEALGTEQNRKTYRRHGVVRDQFGVSYAAMRALAKRIKRDHVLAQSLWATGNHDARILACLIEDPKQVSEAQLEAWVHELDNYIISDEFSNVARSTPFAKDCAVRWIDADGEWIEYAGWNVLAGLSADASIPDSFFVPYIVRIEAQIHGAKNRVRHGMNNALINIGLREGDIRTQAMSAAARVGDVNVDHGETSCVTPNATAYILKTLAYRESKAQKKQRS